MPSSVSKETNAGVICWEGKGGRRRGGGGALLLRCQKSEEGLDLIAHRRGTAIGDGGGSIEIIRFGEEDDFGIGIPGYEIVRELWYQCDRILSVEISLVGDHEIIIDFFVHGEARRRDVDLFIRVT